MQATPTAQPSKQNLNRNLGYLLLPPLTILVLAVLIFAVMLVSYQSRHSNKIFTGVTVGNADLSGLTETEAAAALSSSLGIDTPQITLVNPRTGEEWAFTHAELGMQLDADTTLAQALAVGREGGVGQQMREMYQTWYYGRSLPPTLILDEGQLANTLNSFASDVNQTAINASMLVDGNGVSYQQGQTGQVVDIDQLRSQLTMPLMELKPARIELLVHDIVPTLADTQNLAYEVEAVTSSPVNFYLQNPLDEIDLETELTLPPEQLEQWLRVEVISGENGRYQHSIFIDEVGLRQWLDEYADALYREPVNARFYFDDNTRELVLVAPHINGRELDIEATMVLFQEEIVTANRSIPLVMRPIVPTVHQDATAVELGITELVTQTTTWFYGSTDERKHNIARAAANFFGVVIAPGEEFSFNKYLGSISETDGYEQGFIIIGGQTVEGIGGGVCQVSTTLYQTAFNAGFPITERWEHGYMLNYYNDGEGPGMDATVFSPIVDMKFINNTPHHLLIENYYSTENEALTFKFYSTSLGRTVVKERMPWENVTDIPDRSLDRWEYNPDLEEGEVIQIDWATEGADVTVQRTVLNADGVPLYGTENFTSRYIPVPNVYQYGPGVEPYDYSKVPEY